MNIEITRSISHYLPFTRILKDAQPIVENTLNAIGERLQADIRAEMREDTGAEKESVQFKTKVNSMRGSVTVSSNLVQAAVDENGRKAGSKMAPWKQGSKLYAWVFRHGFVGASLVKTRSRTARFTPRLGKLGRKDSQRARQESIAFRISRKQARDGVPARHVFTRPLHANEVYIHEMVQTALADIARQQNGK